MDGIMISSPYAEEIISGQKVLEYRKRPISKAYLKTRLYLLSEGKVLGVIEFSKQQKLQSQYLVHVQVHEKYDPPKIYYHPNGANIWVKDVIVSSLDGLPKI